MREKVPGTFFSPEKLMNEVMVTASENLRKPGDTGASPHPPIPRAHLVGAPLVGALHKGTHEGCPYETRRSSVWGRLRAIGSAGLKPGSGHCFVTWQLVKVI
jgi:hypothetical protein